MEKTAPEREQTTPQNAFANTWQGGRHVLSGTAKWLPINRQKRASEAANQGIEIGIIRCCHETTSVKGWDRLVTLSV
jgi:hypothetical protein